MDSIVTTEDTIAAIASAISIGKGGVAIIRVSGKDSINSVSYTHLTLPTNREV